MKTFAHDHELPALPVPELHATCAAIPELVAPLVDAPTLENTLAALEEFQKPDGSGERLQSLLTERASGLPGNSSWLRPFWDDMYIAWRGTLPLDMNYFFQFNASRWGGEEALPRFVHALTVVLEQLDAGELEPEATKNGFLSMDQARRLAYTRIPASGRDNLGAVLPGGSATAAVTCQGHWFVLSLYGRDGKPAGARHLKKMFAAIRRQAADLPPGPAVSALTSAPRDEAAEIRDVLQQNLQNRLSFAALESALFAVCLDPPQNSDEKTARALLGGDAACRWFDKSLQIIALENGALGANFEHAGCDAAIWLYLLGCADGLITSGAVRDGEPQAEGGMESCRLLRWDVPDDLERRLAALRGGFARRLKDLDVACHAYPAFSRERLKALNTSPDSFLQGCFQVAQHQVFGRLRSSYEAISMRAFAGGRTECARGSSGEALALAMAMQTGGSSKKLLELYRQAERIHKARMQRCQRGLGVERHMSGLRAMFELHGKALGLEPEPGIFSDPGWLTLKTDALSTSGIGAPFIRYFGFGPVAPDGFGIGYAPRAESTGLVVTCRHASAWSAAEFADAFNWAAGSLAALLSRSLEEET